MPASPLKEFEYELYKISPEDRVKLIDSKLEHLQKLKSNGDKHHLNDYYIQELNEMKKTCTYIHNVLFYLIYMIV